MPELKSTEPSAALMAFVDDLKATLGRHTHLSPPEMLAGASHLVGALLALQDQRTMTVDMGLMLIDANIQAGNAEAVASSFATIKGTA